MNALDTLSTFGPELSGEQLDTVDGGLLFLLVIAGGFALGYGVGYAIDNM